MCFMKLWPFLSFLAYFGQKLVAMATSLTPLQSKTSSLDWSTMKTPCLSNNILVISRRNAFIVIFVPKLVAMVTPLCPLCSGVSQMNSRWHKPYLKTKLCMHVSLTSEVMAIFVIFWPILAKIWLPWQRPLDPCNHKCLLWIG